MAIPSLPSGYEILKCDPRWAYKRAERPNPVILAHLHDGLWDDVVYLEKKPTDGCCPDCGDPIPAFLQVLIGIAPWGFHKTRPQG